MELYQLAENCNYGELQSEMIRDKLVEGITDGTLSEHLHLDPELTLEKAKKMVRQREAVHEQQKTLNGGARSTLGEVKSKRNWKGKPNKAQPNNYRKPRSRACNRCGNAWHPWDKSPAKEAECSHCQKRGHYSTQCYFKRMSEVSIGDNEDLNHAFLDNITNSQEKSWFASIRMDGQSVDFKLDTGAEGGTWYMHAHWLCMYWIPHQSEGGTWYTHTGSTCTRFPTRVSEGGTWYTHTGCTCAGFPTRVEKEPGTRTLAVRVLDSPPV